MVENHCRRILEGMLCLFTFIGKVRVETKWFRKDEVIIELEMEEIQNFDQWDKRILKAIPPTKNDIKDNIFLCY